MVVESMAQTGVEPTYCMGDDIPLAVLSDKSHALYNYFKQRFAQVRGGEREREREREREGGGGRQWGLSLQV
jgi:glutamate synthase (ferredoxin)